MKEETQNVLPESMKISLKCRNISKTITDNDDTKIDFKLAKSAAFSDTK